MSALCQLHLPQQWSNLRYTGRIYVILRYQTAVKKCGKTEYTFCGVYIKPKDFKPGLHVSPLRTRNRLEMLEMES